MKKEQYTKTGGDESYTFPSLITPIIKFINEFAEHNNIKKSELKIWLPFDVDRKIEFNGITLHPSYFVKVFKEYGYQIIVSHIATRQDFFKYEPKEYDVIISNPPFKDKRLFFERAIELGKPFALVNTASLLNDDGLFDLFTEHALQLLMPKERSKFFNDNGLIGASPSFKAFYICKDFLCKKDIEWFLLDRGADVKVLESLKSLIKYKQ